MKNIQINTSTIKDGDMRATAINLDLKSKFMRKNNISSSNLVTMNQVHSSKVIFVSNPGKVEKIKGFDGLITDNKKITLGVYTADCIPIVLCDPKNELLAVLHAGYKGILKGIVNNSLAHLISLGSKLENIQAWIGPSIDECCYDIDYKRLSYFSKKYSLNGEVQKRKGKIYLSLKKIVVKDLVSNKVMLKNISVSKECTSCSEKYFSYRRQKGIKGLNLTIAKFK